MKRLTLIEYSGLIALSASSRSEDQRTQVGGCLVNLDNKRILSTSYNGVATGMPWPEKFNEDRDYKGKMVLHAENNLFNVPNIPECKKMVCLTISPCESCAKLICSNGISEVYYIQEYPREKEFAFRKLFDFYKIKHRSLTADEISNMVNWMKKGLTNLENLVISNQNKIEPEAVQEYKNIVPEIGAKYKIREGAQVGMDMQFWIWPNLPNGDVDKVFVCDDVFHSGGQQASCTLRAYKFGAMGSGYGNGAITVNFKDMILI